MKFGINTIDDFDLHGKTVLCRVDMNQPVDREKGTLKDTTRIEGCAPTIKELSDKGAKVVLMAHQGSDIEYKNFYSTAPHAKVLEEILGKHVHFIEDVCGPAAIAEIKVMKPGDILLLDNVRFMSEEQTLFEKSLKLTHEQQAKTQVVKKLAPLGDLYVCDAFAAAHRDQPTLCGFEQVLPSAMGRLFEKEYSIISGIMESPERPCTFVLGGAKIADAFMMMETVLAEGSADNVLTGGLVANILLISQGYDIGAGSREFVEKSGYNEFIEKGAAIYEKYGDKIVLPKDIAYVENGKRLEADIERVPSHICALDIGEKTIEKYEEVIGNSKVVFVNGPMGVFEEALTEKGTKKVWDAIGNTNAFTVIGGGDSITATKKYGKKEQVSYICTGGGALIRFLTGEELPVVRALKHARKQFGVEKK